MVNIVTANVFDTNGIIDKLDSQIGVLEMVQEPHDDRPEDEWSKPQILILIVESGYSAIGLTYDQQLD